MAVTQSLQFAMDLSWMLLPLLPCSAPSKQMRLQIQRFWRAHDEGCNRVGPFAMKILVGAPPERGFENPARSFPVPSTCCASRADHREHRRIFPTTTRPPSFLMSGVHDASCLRILECDFDIRKGLRANVVLSGATTMFKRVGGRMRTRVDRVCTCSSHFLRTPVVSTQRLVRCVSLGCMGLTRSGLSCTSLAGVGFLCLWFTAHTHACPNVPSSAPSAHSEFKLVMKARLQR